MEKTFKTRLVKGGVAIETKATIDFTGCTPEEVMELAAATVIINEQAVYRISGKIPATATIKVKEQLGRPRGGNFVATPESIAAKMLKLGDDEYKKLLLGMGVSEDQANKMVNKRAKPLAQPAK